MFLEPATALMNRTLVTNPSPTTVSTSATTWTLAIAYSIIALFGLIGNGRVIVIWCILMARATIFIGSRRPSSRPEITAAQTPIVAYVMCLSIAHSMVLTLVPVLVVDMLTGQWPAGPVVCTLFWASENLNKLLSSFILLAFSGT